MVSPRRGPCGLGAMYMPHSSGSAAVLDLGCCLEERVALGIVVALPVGSPGHDARTVVAVRDRERHRGHVAVGALGGEVGVVFSTGGEEGEEPASVLVV